MRSKKLNIIMEISSSIKKIAYYKDLIKRITEDRKSIHEATLSIKVTGVRNTFWVDLAPEECTVLIKGRIRTEVKKQKELESKL